MQNHTDKFFFVLLIVAVAAVWAAPKTSAHRLVLQQQEVPKAQELPSTANPSGEKIIVATGRKVVLLERESKAVIWESTGLRGALCIAALPEGGFLVGEGQSVARLDKDGRFVSRSLINFRLTTDVKSLKDGKMLVSDGPAGTVVEVDWQGNITWFVNGLHHPSEAERLPNGDTLVADGTSQLKEFDSTGKLLRVIRVPRWAAAVKRVEGGTLVGERDRVELLDLSGKSIWSQRKSSRVTGVQRLPSGEYLICEPDAERIAILDANGNVIWEANGLGYSWRAISLQ